MNTDETWEVEFSFLCPLRKIEALRGIVMSVATGRLTSWAIKERGWLRRPCVVVGVLASNPDEAIWMYDNIRELAGSLNANR